MASVIKISIASNICMCIKLCMSMVMPIFVYRLILDKYSILYFEMLVDVFEMDVDNYNAFLNHSDSFAPLFRFWFSSTSLLTRLLQLQENSWEVI